MRQKKESKEGSKKGKEGIVEVTSKVKRQVEDRYGCEGGKVNGMKTMTCQK